MADDATTTAPDDKTDAGKQDDAQKGGDTGKQDTGKTFTQEQLDAIVKDRVRREQEKHADYDDLQAKAEKFDQAEAANQSDLEKVTGERDSLKTENERLKNENMRLGVAMEKGLVGDKASLARRLSGSTKEELETDADDLLKLVGTQDKKDDDAGDGGGDGKDDAGKKGPGMDGGKRDDAADDTTDKALDAFWNSRVPGVYEPTK